MILPILLFLVQSINGTVAISGQTAQFQLKIKKKPAPLAMTAICPNLPVDTTDGFSMLNPTQSVQCSGTLNLFAPPAPLTTTIFLVNPDTSSLIMPVSVIVPPGSKTFTFTVQATP